MRHIVSFALASLAAAVLCTFGCAAKIGSQSDFDSTKSSITNGSPVVLDIRDADKSGTASGVGPARYTSITGDHVQTMQSGTIPRDVFATVNADGSIQFNLSSGSDISAKGVEFNPATKALKVAEFSTLTSEPLRAHNEAYDRLVAYWASRDEASKQAILAQLDTIKSISSDIVPLIKAALGAP